MALEPKNIFERLVYGKEPVQPTRVQGQEFAQIIPGVENPSERVGLGVGLASAGSEFIPGGNVRKKAVKEVFKQIDNLTKNEMVKAVDYIDGFIDKTRPFDQKMEESIGYLSEKYGIVSKNLRTVAN